ncbi:hypothetical protein E143388_08296 [Rhodococcus opacus]|nr:hypothetical protein E143388_08296 [Rhodococcus opacus]
MVADAGYGDTTAFRLALTERGIDYIVAVKGATSAHPGDAAPETAAYSGRGRPSTPRYGPHTTCKDLVLAIDRGQGGDRVDDLGVTLAVAAPAGGAGQLQYLNGVRKQQTVGDLGGLERADLVPTVAVLGGAAQHRDLFPRQGSELSTQVRLVAFDGEDVVPSPADDVLGGLALAMQCVRRDHSAGNVLQTQQLR